MAAAVSHMTQAAHQAKPNLSRRLWLKNKKGAASKLHTVVQNLEYLPLKHSKDVILIHHMK